MIRQISFNLNYPVPHSNFNNFTFFRIHKQDQIQYKQSLRKINLMLGHRVPTYHLYCMCKTKLDIA